MPLAAIPAVTPTVQSFLYGITRNGPAHLYRIGRTNGVVTDIGPLVTNAAIQFTGLGELGEQIYAWSPTQLFGGLFTVNRQTGGASLLGGPTVIDIALGGLDGVLYGSDRAGDDDLFTINTMTGALTSVREEYSSVDVVALAGLNGVFYGSRNERLSSGIQPGGVLADVGSFGIGRDMAGMAGLDGSPLRNHRRDAIEALRHQYQHGCGDTPR